MVRMITKQHLNSPVCISHKTITYKSERRVYWVSYEKNQQKNNSQVVNQKLKIKIDVDLKIFQGGRHVKGSIASLLAKHCISVI